MHASAYRLCEFFAAEYLGSTVGRVLDVGSCDVNGTLKPIFLGWDYVGLDIAEGPNVDIVASNQGWPLTDSSFDVAVSSSCFEHDPRFWITFKEMARVVRSGGWVYICAPSQGPYHGHPGDCWRFYKDAWQALADSTEGVELLSSRVYDNEPWHDSVGIYKVL